MTRTAIPIEPSQWMTNALRLAGLYHLCFGAFAVLFPTLPFVWAGMSEPNLPWLWQCIGMLLGVFGIGYLLAARDPFRHWPIVVAGLLGKVLVPIGFVDAALRGEAQWAFCWVVVLNDLVWWVPFALILRGAHVHHHPPRVAEAVRPMPDSAPVQRIQQMLQTLSAPAQVQLRLFPELAQHTVTSAAQFSEALAAATGTTGRQVLQPVQVDLLRRVEAVLQSLAAPEAEPLRTAAAVGDAPEWHQLRGLARQALVTFGWSVDVPLSMLRTRE
jgi:hypothetical protein